jgi:hypothetical protein
MSKEHAEEPVLWYRPRVDLSGQVTIPSEKSPKKPDPKSSKKPELEEVLVISSEKSQKSSETIKKKRGRKPKLSGCLEISTAENKSSKSQEPKNSTETLDSAKKLKKTSKDLSFQNGNHSQEAIVLIDDEIPDNHQILRKSSEVTKSPDSSKIAELERIVKEKIKKVQEQDKRLSTSSNKMIEPEVFKASPFTEVKTSQRKSLPMSSGLTCPDQSCLQIFPDHSSLLDHIKEVHALQCKMPYCTFSTFTFQEYLDHFEQVHCANLTLPDLPQKRGPRVASKEPLPLKETKLST